MFSFLAASYPKAKLEKQQPRQLLSIPFEVLPLPQLCNTTGTSGEASGSGGVALVSGAAAFFTPTSAGDLKDNFQHPR